MSEESKKISFSFSKSVGKTKVQNALPPQKKKVDYIESIDDKAIKIIGGEAKEDNELVIPMPTGNIWHDRIKNKVNADIFEPKPEVEIKKENVDELNFDNSIPKIEGEVLIKKEPEDKPTTLEEQAAKEILEDLKSNKTKTAQKIVIPTKEDDLRGKEESTLEDYERVSIEGFGMGMLRGMGWKPDEGIGKQAKIMENTMPELRPRGLGLGANKPNVQTHENNSSKNEKEKLKIVSGACIKIIAGNKNGSYGKVQGFDDEGRVFVKLKLGENLVSINEAFVQPVTLTEYSKNSNVLNAKKFQEYKNGEKNKISKQVVENSDDRKINKKSKKKRYSSSDMSSSEDERRSERESRRRRRDNSDSGDDRQDRKKSKKKYSSSDEDESNHESRRRDKSYKTEEDKRKKSKKSKRKRDNSNNSEKMYRKKSKKKHYEDDSDKESKRKSSYQKDEKKDKNSKRHRRSRSRSYSPRR